MRAHLSFSSARPLQRRRAHCRQSYLAIAGGLFWPRAGDHVLEVPPGVEPGLTKRLRICNPPRYRPVPAPPVPLTLGGGYWSFLRDSNSRPPRP